MPAAIRMTSATTIMPGALLEQSSNNNAKKMTMKTKKNKNSNRNAYGVTPSCSSSSSSSVSDTMIIDEDRSSSSSSSSSSSIVTEETSAALSSSSSSSSLLSLSIHNNNSNNNSNNNGGEGGGDNLTVTVSSSVGQQHHCVSFLQQHQGRLRGRKSCMKKVVVALRDDVINDDDDDDDWDDCDVLDPYYSCNKNSTSTKNKNKKKKKKVRFARRSEYKYVEAVDWSQVSPPITIDELFYTSSNYEKMRGECSWTIRCHQMMMSPSSSSSSTSSSSSSDINHHHGRDGDSYNNGWVESYEDDDEFFRHEFEGNNLCLRGLEGQTEEATRKRWMGHAKQTRALMIEQDRQKHQQQSRRSVKPHQRNPMHNIHRMYMLTQHNQYQRAHHLPLLFRLHHIGSNSMSSSNIIDNDDVRYEDYEQRLADACREQSTVDVTEAYRVGLEDAAQAQKVYYESIHNHQTHDNDNSKNDPLQEWWCSYHEVDDIIERLTQSSVFIGTHPKKKKKKTMKRMVDDEDDANGHSDSNTFMIENNQATAVTQQLAPVVTDECYRGGRNDTTATARLTVLDTLPWPLKILHNIMRPKSCWE